MMAWNVSIEIKISREPLFLAHEHSITVESQAGIDWKATVSEYFYMGKIILEDFLKME